MGRVRFVVSGEKKSDINLSIIGSHVKTLFCDGGHLGILLRV